MNPDKSDCACANAHMDKMIPEAKKKKRREDEYCIKESYIYIYI